jgi:hypothetical protein
MLEMKSIVSKIVRNFQLSVTEENAQPIVMAALVLQTENGINLSFTQRN